MKKHLFISIFFLLLISIPFKVGAEEETERVMIYYDDAIDGGFLQNEDIEVHHIFEEYNAVSATIPTSVKKELEASANVKLIEDDSIVKTNAQTESWGYSTLQVNQAKTLGLTGKGVKVGIIDTGIESNHPDLYVAGGATFVANSTSYEDDEGHGTHVAGIIAALDNDIGAVGVAPDAEIYAIKSLNSAGVGNLSDVIAGVNWAIDNNMDIINLSLTSTEGSILLEEVLQKAYSQGMMIVAASGNSVKPIYRSSDVLYPARYSFVTSVGSVDSGLTRSTFSYFGTNLDFVAPGEDIYSTFIGTGSDQYENMSGTSMASPFVAGMAALYEEAYPTYSNTQIESLMQASALDLGNTGKDSEYGYGLVQPPSTIDPEPQPTEEEETPTESLFSDIASDSWYADEVMYLSEKGIINGYSDGSFHPYSNVTRAEAVSMLGRALGLSGDKSTTAFADVPYSSFASGYIKSATAAGIISGYADGTFHPNTNIIRGDMAVILQRAFQFPNATSNYFSDVAATKHYYNAINSLAEQGITEGFADGTFRADLNITRAEFSVFLAKALDDSFK